MIINGNRKIIRDKKISKDEAAKLMQTIAKKIGVNLDELLVSQPNTGEEALGIVKKLILGSAVKLIVVDSVAALVPKKELEGERESLEKDMGKEVEPEAIKERISEIISDICKEVEKPMPRIEVTGSPNEGEMIAKFFDPENDIPMTQLELYRYLGMI